MLIKLAIIAGIIILGVALFSEEIGSLLPTEAASAIDSLKNNTSDLGSRASDSIREQVDLPIGRIVNQTAGPVSDQIGDAGDRVGTELSKVKESSHKVVNKTAFDFNPIESIKDLFEAKC